MANIAFTELRSPRLILRRLRRDDLTTLCAYRCLPAVARYQSWESYGPDEAARLIDGQAELEPGIPGTWFQLAIVVTATGTMIGDCGLHFRKEDPRQLELGITLAPSHQKHGYATEAIESLLGFSFGSLNAHRVAAVTDAENRPAASLFPRLGFRLEAHFVEHLWFKGQWGSEFVFALLRRDWEHRRTSRST